MEPTECLEHVKVYFGRPRLHFRRRHLQEFPGLPFDGRRGALKAENP